MTSKLMRFQESTVRAACEVLGNSNGPRRFLVADETGLGKTVVAREIVRSLSIAAKKRTKPFVVFYVTSGQRIAHQNRERLVEFLEDSKAAISFADRLSAIPMVSRRSADIELFALTPYTSFPDDARRQGVGRASERAYLEQLLGRAFPGVEVTLKPKILQGAVSDKSWNSLAYARGQADAASDAFVAAFRSAVRESFPDKTRDVLAGQSHSLRATKFIAKLRAALSLAALRHVVPDLIVMDEFQKFRELLSTEGRRNAIVHELFEPRRGKPPAVLLLSATPYPTFSTGLEQINAASSHIQLFELIEFLAGDLQGRSVRKNADEQFRSFGEHLRAIARHADGESAQHEHVMAARGLRDSLQTLLRDLMSRTERETGAGTNHIEVTPMRRLKAKLDPLDIRGFRYLVDSFAKPDKADALPYWLSVPLPAQALGPRYKGWHNAEFQSKNNPVRLTYAALSGLRLPADWAHPKLRALSSELPPAKLALPWVCPSLPWWPLKGKWRGADEGQKMLVFGRFRATPQSVAALTSLGVEAAMLPRGQGAYSAKPKRKLRARLSQMPILALFHPSPLLIRWTDPSLEAGTSGRRDIRRLVAGQLKRKLDGLGVKVVDATMKERQRRRPTWALLSALERKAQLDADVMNAWARVAGGEDELCLLLREWKAAPAIANLSPREFKDLLDMAISSPGVVCGRALLRHHPDALAPAYCELLVRLCWTGLRTYLDEPVFHELWRSSGTTADNIRGAMEDGCFESVLDEHFWMRASSLADGAKELASDLTASLRLSAGAFTFQSEGCSRVSTSKQIRVRCHAAVPFGGTDDEAGRTTDPTKKDKAPPARADEIRKAFNTPFWPHVVTTTSVGQEGLDFHTWCDKVAHWDLCPSPVELEQREGRVHRYGGLMVRRRLASELSTEVFAAHKSQSVGAPSQTVALPPKSLWTQLAELANARFGAADPRGMSPWWQLEGANVTRYVFVLPLSKDIERFHTLQEQRLIYRLALGQPNSEDLIETLARGSDATRATIRELALDLSAYGREQECGEL